MEAVTAKEYKVFEMKKQIIFFKIDLNMVFILLNLEKYSTYSTTKKVILCIYN